jgi:hypothetical protein
VLYAKIPPLGDAQDANQQDIGIQVLFIFSFLYFFVVVKEKI